VFAIAAALSRALFLLGMALVGGVLLIVVYDVTSRNLGLHPPTWAVATVEYALLWIALLTMPDLVRTRGHVAVEVVLAAMAPAARRRLSDAVSLAAAAICAFMAVRSGQNFWYAWQAGTYEIRSYDMPEWIIYLPMPIAFSLAALMFVRLVALGESYHGGRAETGEGL
jgi:TRAP-type C4-dicarboxylate transport system permease small subunit